MNSPRRFALRSSIAAAFVAACVATPAAAQEAGDDSLECGIKSTTIYFGNGINTSRFQAELSRSNLRFAYQVRFENDYPDGPFEFKVAYNQTANIFIDTREVLQQNASPEQQRRLASLSEAQLESLASLSRERFQALSERLQDAYGGVVTGNPFIDLLADPAADSLIDLIVDADGDLFGEEFAIALQRAQTDRSLIELYENDLDAGGRVIVVAHSQGTLFARDNVEAVIAADPARASSIGVVGVGVAANRIPNGGDYVTANDDLVILGLRAATFVDGIAGNEPVPSNLGNDPSVFDVLDPRDALNHNFLKSYFRPGLDSRTEIDRMVRALASGLTFPESVIGSGALRVTLNWGSEPDVDLHAYEPDGTHVFYQRLVGNSGTLDRDDTSSFGPENYFVPCDSVQVGTYGFGVNYYFGEGPETARLRLRLSDGQSTSASVPLTSSRGSAGNNPPVTLRVTVTQDEEGRYAYDLGGGGSFQQATIGSGPGSSPAPGSLESVPK